MSIIQWAWWIWKSLYKIFINYSNIAFLMMYKQKKYSG